MKRWIILFIIILIVAIFVGIFFVIQGITNNPLFS